MADTDAAPAPAASPKKKKTSTKPKKPKTAPSHPKVSQMVDAAITNLKERGGSSLQAIKKYISSNYKVDIERMSPFIKKYLKTAVSNGAILQTKGKGASGSFKMSSSEKKGPKKVTATKKAKAPAKKAAKPKKAAATPKKKPAKKPAAKKAKTPKKPKSPKPKKAKPAKKTPAKKAAKGKK